MRRFDEPVLLEFVPWLLRVLTFVALLMAA
jgi:hypothetical protein